MVEQRENIKYEPDQYTYDWGTNKEMEIEFLDWTIEEVKAEVAQHLLKTLNKLPMTNNLMIKFKEENDNLNAAQVAS
jgi:hypothetical protein